MQIEWNVILWTCITISVLVGVFGVILSIISAVNMKKRRKEVGADHYICDFTQFDSAWLTR